MDNMDSKSQSDLGKWIRADEKASQGITSTYPFICNYFAFQDDAKAIIKTISNNLWLRSWNQV